MESRLFHAAHQGDTHELHALLKEDPLTLHKLALLPYSNTSPLHVATLASKTLFVKEILKQMPSLAWDRDKDGLTPLHIASAIGNVEIVREILKVSSNLCLVKDKGGRIALHYATMKGRIQEMDELLSKCPEIVKVTANEENVLHLAVINNQIEAFSFLIENLGSQGCELLNVVDGYGKTALQLAQSTKQLQVLNLLRDHGITNMDQITQDIQDQDQELTSEVISVTIENQDEHDTETSTPQYDRISIPALSYKEPPPSSYDVGCKIFPSIAIGKGVITILAGIIATTAFKEGLSPPPTMLKPNMILNGNCFFQSLKHGLSLDRSTNQCPPATYYLFLSFNTALIFCSVFLIFLHQIPGFLQTLLPASLVLLLLSYLVILLYIIPNASAFVIIQSVAFLTFAYICFVRSMGKRLTKWTIKKFKCRN